MKKFYALTLLLSLAVLKADSFDKKNKLGLKKSYCPITQAPTGPNEGFFVDFVGKGDIQKSLNQGADIQANTGIGLLFERYRGISKKIQSFEVEATINIASTSDSIKANFNNGIVSNRRDFGTYILNPVSTKQALYINSNIYFGGYEDTNKWGKFAKYISGVNMRVTSSNSVWSYNDKATNLGVISGRIGIFHDFWPDNYRLDKEGRALYALIIGANYCARGIVGDISSSSNINTLKNILNTQQTFYHGFELNFGFRLNNIRAEFQMPIIATKKYDNPMDSGKPIKNSVDGLTNTQFIFSIKFIGGFSMKLDKNNITSRTPTVADNPE